MSALNEAGVFEEKRPFRDVKTYVVRASRMTSAQKRNYAELAPKWCVPYRESLIDYTALFGNDNPVTIEIGFGMGSATAEIASNNPDKNYIGIEVHKPGIGKLLGEIRNRSLEILRIIEGDAAPVLSNMIADASVSAFHVFFPDPWPKKRHHKRRLVQRPRTDLFASKLEEGGYFYMVTDWSEYADFALSELTATEGFVNAYEGFAEKKAWRPETKFEMRGIRAAREIRELYFLKRR